MPVGRQSPRSAQTSRLWPSGGMHLWPTGGTSSASSHPRGHLVYAAQGVLSVHTERGTSIVPANRVAWTPAGFTHYHRAHGQTDMRILFLPASLARLAPGHPAVFTVSDLAREALLTLTGPRNFDAAAPGWDRAARSRLRRILVDELRAAPEQPLQLPEPRDDRLRAIAQRLYEHPADNASLAELGRTAGASARTLSRLLHDELGLTFYQWRTQLRDLSRAGPAGRRPRHDQRRLRLRMGEPQQLHRRLRRHHRHHPGPLPNQPGTPPRDHQRHHWAGQPEAAARNRRSSPPDHRRRRARQVEPRTVRTTGRASRPAAARGDAAGEQAAAEERALQGPVAVHAAAAEAGRLARRVQTGHRLPARPTAPATTGRCAGRRGSCGSARAAGPRSAGPPPGRAARAAGRPASGGRPGKNAPA